MITHFELGNSDYLDSAIRSVYYHLSKRGDLLRLEKKILILFKKAFFCKFKKRTC